MDLTELVAVVWKRRVAALLVFVLTLAFAAAFALSRPERYDSTATLALTPNAQKGQSLVAADNLSALLGTYAETAKSTVTRRRAQRDLGHPLGADIDATTQAGTGILRITARAGDPRVAATAASAVARAFAASIARNGVLDARVVDAARPDPTPVQPRPPLILLVAAILGGFGGILLAFALEHFRRRIETPADVAEHTPAPLLARLPRERGLSRGPARLVWGTDGPPGLQERLRALRTNVGFLLDGTARVLEVTSPDPGQGTSTVVANLGVAFGQVGIETVIVDADLREPAQQEIFGLDNTRGVTTAMTRGGDPPLEPSGHPNLWVLPSGPIPPDPTEILHIRFASLLESLRAMGALVLIDAPAVLPFSDARLVAPHADGVVLVLAAGRVRPSALGSALDQLALVDARLLGVVLNATGPTPDGAARRGPGRGTRGAPPAGADLPPIEAR